MKRMRKDVRIKVTLPPDTASLLASAVADRGDAGMTMNTMMAEVIRYYMTRPEDALDSHGLRICCGTAPLHGHRGTCRFGAMRGGPDSAEYQALQRMWQAKP